MFAPQRLIRRTPAVEMDTVKARHKEIGHERDVQLLERCQTLWENWSDFRERRARSLRFCYGDQWGDIIEIDGKKMTYREYIMRQGNVVLQNNQVKSKIDTIAGIVVKEQNEPICSAHDRDEQQYGEVMTATLQANCGKNNISNLYSLFVKELGLGGLCMASETYDDTTSSTRRLDSWTKYINPNTVFMASGMTDPTFSDLSLVGRFEDMYFEDVAAKFAHSAHDYDVLRTVYPEQFKLFRQESITGDPTEQYDNASLVFLQPSDPTLCRVFEVWTKESRPRIRLHDTNEGKEYIIEVDDQDYRRRVREENRRRQALAKQQGWPDTDVPYIIGDGYGQDSVERNGWFIDTFWYCRYLGPDGTVLWEGESPFADRMHPYSICATPMLDGYICGYYNDAIDLNIAMNRAMVLHDWLLRAQQKGVTVVPKSIVPENDLKQFARSWASVDGMVFIDMKEGQEQMFPKSYFGPGTTFNVSELLNTYSKQMENSTSVSAAIQGKTPYSGTSGVLYAQMANNSSTTIAALLSQFHSFLKNIHTRKLKNIAQFYEPARYASIVGKIDGVFDNPNLDLNKVGDIEYDLSVEESTETPVYRAVINDDAKEFLMNGFISFEEYLTITNVPYADKILQGRQAREAEMKTAQEQGLVPTGSPGGEAPSAQPPQAQPRYAIEPTNNL